ncbi:nuclear transport factor 2 family protein [Kitasatospora sp. NPDC050543]|uniref:nuclear transport factor 2 family protein n=1 Tax=Kitasatospora sp. NPDC050543 TaxID=3364054 RepID=UPI0037AC018C
MTTAQQPSIGRRQALGIGAALGFGALAGPLASATPAAAAPAPTPTPTSTEQVQEPAPLTAHHRPNEYAGFPAMPNSVLQFFAASQRADADAWAESFAVNAVFHDPVGQPPLHGREAIRARLRSVLPQFRPFIGITPIEAHTVGDLVAVSWRAAAVTRSNRPVNWSGINIYQLDSHGLIREAKAYFNQSVLQAQLDGR